MKKSLKFIACQLALVLAFTSCSKDNEDVIENEEVNFTSNIEIVSFNTNSGNRGSFSSSGTMLSFPTFQDFEDTYNMLDNQMEAHDDAFVAQYDHLTLDELDAMEDSTGFVDNQPLIDFENQYGFGNSLRVTYENAENAWLANSELLLENDPEKDMFFDEIEQAMLNEHQEVMIAGKVYVFGKEDNTYEINDNFAASLDKINNNEDVSNDPNIKATSKWDSEYCASWKADEEFSPLFDNGKRKMKFILKLRQAPFIGKTKARIVSYKKKNNGNWRKSRRHIGVSLQKNLKKNNCSTTGPTGYSSKSIKKRKQRKTTQFDWGIALPSKGQRGQSVFGTFYYNNTSNYWALTW